MVEWVSKQEQLPPARDKQGKAYEVLVTVKDQDGFTYVAMATADCVASYSFMTHWAYLPEPAK